MAGWRPALPLAAASGGALLRGGLVLLGDLAVRAPRAGPQGLGEVSRGVCGREALSSRSEQALRRKKHPLRGLTVL